MSQKVIKLFFAVPVAVALVVTIRTLLPQQKRLQSLRMSEWLQILGTSTPPENPLELRQVSYGAQEDLSFEVRISYDSLHKSRLPPHSGFVALLVDDVCISFDQRASNGNCLLTWPAIYGPPGTHQLKARLVLSTANGAPPLEATGPPLPIVLTNSFRFDLAYNKFSASRGAVLYADAGTSSAAYQIELYDATWTHLKTFAGSASNGIVQEHWDLRDDRGTLITDNRVNAVYSIATARGSEVKTQELYRVTP
jgi:hypothetical protein